MIAPSLVKACRAAVLCMLLAQAAVATGQTATVPALSAQLTQAETDLTAVDRALDAHVDEQQRQLLRSRALAAKSAASEAATHLQDQLTLIDARISQLGPATPGVTEAPDIRAQRTSLARQRSTLDSAVKRGGLLGVTADQLVDEIEQSQAEQFGEKISTRAPSPLSPGFWRAVLLSVPRDARHIGNFFARGGDQVRAQLRLGFPWLALLGVLIAAVLLLPGRVAAQRLGQRLLVDGAPGHRVRRSGYAIWRVVTGALAPLLAGMALVQGLRWSALVPDRWDGLLGALVAAMTFAGLTSAIGGALLMRRQPSWRVAPLGDVVAQRLRPYSLILAGIAFASILLDAFNIAVGASAAARIASQAAEALLHLLLIGATLLALGRVRAAQDDDAGGETTRAGLGLVTLLAWLLATLALVSLLTGYIGFSLFIVQLVTWAVVLGSAAYLTMAAVDDIATTLFAQSSAIGRTLVRGLGLRGSRVDQFGVLLSAVLRVVTATATLGMLLTPFGAGNGVGTLFGRLGVLAQGVDVGGVAISPGAIVRGLLVLGIGLALVRGFMGWLEKRYLPVTDLDGSGRNSVSLVARYVAMALAVIWSLASLGIGVERIAILLSALSVGIGFGLQAITQNFISGLILLAERPIKIGDLVRVGNDEGDVKRISVRSTEIELADHSTLIVPNSELITKSVLNKTLSDPLGRIQIQFSAPIEVDADRVRGIVGDCFAAEAAILAEPAPAVFIDSIADGRIMFNCFAHVVSPRAAYSARSNVFAALLRRFRKEEIDIGTVPQRLELAPSYTIAATPAPAGDK